MCDRQVLNTIQERVFRAAKYVLGDKLEKVILFGSYARGDFDDESDIDFFVLADVKQKDTDDIRRGIRAVMGDVDLEYGVVICIHVTGCSFFHKFRNAMPYLMNVIKDGKELAYA